MSDFKTIESKSEGFYKEKGSKFLAFAFPVSSEEEVKEIQDLLRKEYYDARHHCFAWVLGMTDQSWRANDDGEPAHSAGDPILGQIRSHQLTNVLVVVIRYFGGTKLGVGGLIHAYKVAADEALSAAKKKVIFESTLLQMEFSYEMLSQAERLVQDFNLDVKERDFTSSCLMKALIRKDHLSTFREKTKDLYAIDITLLESS